MVVNLKIAKNSFRNDKGEDIEYYSYVANIAGEDIPFLPKEDYTKLVKYLLSKSEIKK